MTDIRPGRSVGPPPFVKFVLITIAIDEIFKGAPVTQSEGSVQVEYGLYPHLDLELMRARIPEHKSLFFLFNQGLIAERTDHPDDVEHYRYQYTEVNPAQGTFRDIESRARGIFIEVFGTFPADSEGGPYQRLLRRVRAAAAQLEDDN